MRRRRYLSLLGSAGLAGLAGCRTENIGQLEEPTETPTATATETATPSPSPTPTNSPTPTATPEPAAFELASLDAPLSVQAGEPYTIAFTVRNTGGQPGVFETRIEMDSPTGRVVSDPWTIRLRPGESYTFESQRLRERTPGQYRFRLTAFDKRFNIRITTAPTATPEPTPTITAPPSPTPKPPELVGRIEYERQWQGSVSLIDNGESESRTIEGDGDWREELGWPDIASLNAQKRDESPGRLRVTFRRGGRVIAEAETTAAYGVAQVSKRFY